MIDQFREIITECGKYLLKMSESEKAIGSWQANQFKAKADKLAHYFLIKSFKAQLNLPIVSEEDDESYEHESQEYIIIDPIDGTASFSHGYKGWVTQAALIKNQKPVISVVFAPAFNELFWAESGKGSFCNGRRLALKQTTSQQITSIIDNYPTPQGITKEVVDHFKIPHYEESGSLGLKICRVASGSSELFFKEMNPRDWDLAAPQLIIEEAGGILTDAFGRKIKYGSTTRSHKGLIASSNEQIMKRVSAWYAQKSK
jgi:fructose-1,6-bisphosphatase/inositol monophosphatase family enzyme